MFRDTSIGKHYIELAFLTLDLRKESVEIGKAGDIALYAGHVSADFLCSRGQLPITASRDEDIGAFVHEPLRGSETYSRGASGNHRHFSLQLAHYRYSFFPGEAHRRSACGPGCRLLSAAAKPAQQI